MQRIEKTVFISYRRTNVPWALAIFQNLTQYGYDAFFDYSGIASGDFETVILENIKARAHFLVILTPSALERCDEPGDWLRREIGTAFDSRRNIVPLMLEGFDFGTPTIAKQLTGTLAPLSHYNALNVPADYFLEAMGRLRERYLNIPLDAVLQPASLPAQRAAAEQKEVASTAPTVGEEELTAQQWFERGLNAVDLDEQLRFYSEALRIKPNYVEALNNRGAARRAIGDFEHALQDYSEAICIDPNSFLAFNNRGNARGERGDLEGALRDYEEAIRLNASYSVAYGNRGYARYLKGDLDGALQDCDEAIRLRPEIAEAYCNRAWALLAMGETARAMQDSSEAIRLKPSLAEAFCVRGDALRAQGDLTGAMRDYEEAVRLKPDYREAIAHRGVMLDPKTKSSAVS